MIQFRTSITATCLALFLSACVSPTAAPPPHIASATALHSWEAEGKLGVRSANTAKAVNFHWQHSPEQLDIRLHGALGLGSVYLKRDANGIFTLKSKDGTEQADSAEDLLYATLGWSIPVTALEYWIKGLPSPAAPVTSQTYDSQGNLTQLQQQGWKLLYSKHTHFGSLSLPQKIIASRDGLRLTIAINTWRFK